MHRLKTLFKFLGFVALTLLLLEGALRFRFAGPVQYLEPAGDPELLYQLKARASTVATGTLFKIPPFTVHINARRCRAASTKDETIAWDKTRVLFVGDSFTFGQGVDFEDTWPKRVTQLLLDRGLPLQHYNAAVDGYNFSQIVRAVELRLPEFRPHLLVVPLFSNDLDGPYQLQKMFPQGKLEATLLTHSRIFRMAMLVKYMRSDILRPAPLLPSQVEEGLERILSAARKEEAKVLFVFLSGLPKEQVDVGQALLARGIEPVQVPSSAHEEQYIIPGNRHWNQKGNQRVANLLASGLEDALASSLEKKASSPTPKDRGQP